MKLGLDLDGVILDHTKAKILVAKRYGYTITPRQTPSDVLKTLLPWDTYRTLQGEIYDTDIARTTPLMEGAHKGLMYVREVAEEIWLISRRKDPTFAIAALTYHGLWPSFFSEKNVRFVNTKEAKAEEAAQQSITYFLDDEAKVLTLMTSVSRRLHFDPWLVHVNSSFERVPSWEVFIALLEQS